MIDLGKMARELAQVANDGLKITERYSGGEYQGFKVYPPQSHVIQRILEALSTVEREARREALEAAAGKLRAVATKCRDSLCRVAMFEAADLVEKLEQSK